MDATDLVPCRASHEGMALVTVCDAEGDPICEITLGQTLGVLWTRETQIQLAEIIADAINRAAR